MTKEEAYDVFNQAILNLRCGDSGCIFGKPKGMMTNGGCRTLKANFDTRFALRSLAYLWRELQEQVES
ncbi:MAG: hypothetical protein ACXABY_10580 [Candidatus Thorarchaeota archaeon]|jgi:hypothetical protein